MSVQAKAEDAKVKLAAKNAAAAEACSTSRPATETRPCSLCQILPPAPRLRWLFEGCGLCFGGQARAAKEAAKAVAQKDSRSKYEKYGSVQV